MRKKEQKTIKRFCRDCNNSRDYHSMSLEGKPILCKCNFQRYSMLLNHDYCEHFKQRL